MKSRILLALTVLCRLLVTLGTTVLLAKQLPPDQFGLFATAMGGSMIATLFADYGFVMRALREVGARPESAGAIMTASLRAKAVLTVVVSLVGLVVCLCLRLPVADKLVISVVWLATFANSFGDTALIAFRSLRAFGSEVRVVVTTSLVHAAIMLVGFWAHLPILEIAGLYLATRLIYAALAFHNLRALCSLDGLFSRDFSGLGSQLKAASPYAFDSILTNLFAQLDGVIVASVLGLHAAGVYQAGARLVQGILPFAAMLSSFHIPQMARRQAEGQLTFRRDGWRVFLEFSLIGVVGGIGLVVAGPIYIKHFLGPAYAMLNTLWLGFATFTLLRFAAAGLGAYLIGHGASFIRPFCTLVAGIITISLYMFVMPKFGTSSAPWIAAAGSGVLALAYIIVAARIKQIKPDTAPAAQAPADAA